MSTGHSNQHRDWAWHPALPLQRVPVFVWPPRPISAVKFLLSMAFLGSMIAPYAGLALLTWVYLQPALERCTEFQFDWVVQIFLRNLFLLVVIAGGFSHGDDIAAGRIFGLDVRYRLGNALRSFADRGGGPRGG